MLARLLLAPALLVTTRAQAPTKDPWAEFTKLPIARQQAAATEFVAALATSPIGEALRKPLAELAAAAVAPQPAHAKAPTPRRGPRTIEFAADTISLPRRVDYSFGVGTIDPIGKPTSTAHPTPPRAKPAADPIELHQALAGCVPGADLALAELLRRLDQDRGGDAFAAFLQSWRNGDESFYEALDRTAGTPDAVFFFDVMLDAFRGQFGGSGENRLRPGLQQAHDALHDAFLSYRQYRGFREAIAWSLVLPPDVPLPSRLQRYEAKVSGGYSLRQQVVMACAALHHDLAALIALVHSKAPPLPQPVWSQRYDPYPTWLASWQALQAGMIERAGSTDAFLAAAEAERREFAQQLARLAEEQLQRAIAGSKPH